MRAETESPALRETTATAIARGAPLGVLDDETAQSRAVAERQDVALELRRAPQDGTARRRHPRRKARRVEEHLALADDRRPVGNGQCVRDLVLAGANENLLARVGGSHRGLELRGRRHDDARVRVNRLLRGQLIVAAEQQDLSLSVVAAEQQPRQAVRAGRDAPRREAGQRVARAGDRTSGLVDRHHRGETGRAGPEHTRTAVGAHREVGGRPIQVRAEQMDGRHHAVPVQRQRRPAIGRAPERPRIPARAIGDGDGRPARSGAVDRSVGHDARRIHARNGHPPVGAGPEQVGDPIGANRDVACDQSVALENPRRFPTRRSDDLERDAAVAVLPQDIHPIPFGLGNGDRRPGLRGFARRLTRPVARGVDRSDGESSAVCREHAARAARSRGDIDRAPRDLEVVDAAWPRRPKAATLIGDRQRRDRRAGQQSAERSPATSAVPAPVNAALRPCVQSPRNTRIRGEGEGLAARQSRGGGGPRCGSVFRSQQVRSRVAWTGYTGRVIRAGRDVERRARERIDRDSLDALDRLRTRI